MKTSIFMVSEYPRFVRGEVRKIYVSKNEVVCQLVDYHDELTVPFSNLFHLPEAALHISPMCFTVILEGNSSYINKL